MLYFVRKLQVEMDKLKAAQPPSLPTSPGHLIVCPTDQTPIFHLLIKSVTPPPKLILLVKIAPTSPGHLIVVCEIDQTLDIFICFAQLWANMLPFFLTKMANVFPNVVAVAKKNGKHITSFAG